VVVGLAATSVVLWSAASTPIYTMWAVAYGIANAGAVALLALVLNELFGPVQIGRLMGLAMVFFMAGTIAGNLFSAAVFDRVGSYLPVWQTYTVLMLLTVVPVELLRRIPSRASRS
jgi:MFS family permease